MYTYLLNCRDQKSTLKGITVMQEQELEGLRGWLILVGIGIILSPLRIIFAVFPTYYELFSDGSLEFLATPGTELYSPLWAPTLYGEMIVNIILVLLWIFVGFLFFLKKKIFKTYYIGLLVFTLIFIIVDALAFKAVIPDEPLFDPETTKEVFRSVIACCIWVPYILVSKRVEATFTR